ncbi:RNA 2',3'-cyclic phosphodiesterase [Dyella sp. AD56]|uniref:2'-5' RNA ligase family protein n=1 Tax=Dyella sp. AD56 TaxID=1528744 RepID=UPI000C822946|nr:2'-5' RNA ligase family protein [Dyella sp. AD56]PMQ02630.1 RNA 2',3'-cyclic phosphodiesterase [Dyella sp. AD56]
MARTLLALLVPEAEPVVGSFRELYDPSARRGLGAHITLIYPFIDSELLTPGLLARVRDVAAELPAPMFRLAEVRTFPSVVWLAPEPSKPLVHIATALERAFPDHPKGGGAFPDFVPHLSVARNVQQEKTAVINELQARLADHGPIYGWCESLSLLVSENRRWREWASYPFLY